MFQSTRLREARPTSRFLILRTQCFNPRACGRRDQRLLLLLEWHVGFNPRACGRRDVQAVALNGLDVVSIHAPAGGATRWRAIALLPIQFQSTRLREARPPARAVFGSLFSFQSTRLREARRHFHNQIWCCSCFNPRACGRRDTNILRKFPIPLVSIHAPAGGATFSCGLKRCDSKVSIHAPAGGATQRPTSNACREKFQSTRLREARLSESAFLALTIWFQSTRLREARPY